MTGVTDAAVLAEKAALRRLCAERAKKNGSAGASKWADALEALPQYAAAKTLFCYVSALPGEADTGAVTARALELGKRLCVPRCHAGGVMEAVAISSLEELAPGFYGLPEPPAELSAVPPGEIDLIVVPGLAFDSRGGRLGRGGGYYDRYLAGCPGFSVGLCPAYNKLESVPAEGWDRPVDTVIFL